MLDEANGEVCDNGINDGSYETCDPDCSLAPYCGDGEADAPYEHCDLGTAGNTGDYNTCNVDCTWPDRCGDGIVQSGEGETCDDGVNDGSYGGCTPECLRAPQCGDSVVDTDYDETCDDGLNSGAYETCNPDCSLAAFCGDGSVDVVLGGEQCDSTAMGGKTCTDLNGNGVKEPGDYDGGGLACTVDCAIDTSGCYVCGDGVKNGLEQCDGTGLCGIDADCAGATCADFGFPENSGLACTFDCTLDLTGCDTATCGNGTINGDELCDGVSLGGKACNDLDGDGVLGEPGDFDGGTLGCATDCTLDTSGCYVCGDGVKNGDELCDGDDTGTETCETLGFVGGNLVCNATCDGYDQSGCHECESCMDCEGQACMDYECGACITTADCCAPLVCSAGVCVECVELGQPCADSADCCEGICFDLGTGARCWQL